MVSLRPLQIMNPTLSALFPNMSKSCRDANTEVPATLIPKADKNETMVARKPKKRGLMNKTESEYALILEALKRKGEILRYEFEGITLRWADMKYTPDFVVFTTEAITDHIEHTCIKLIEVKGGHIWDRDIVRFKGARAYWPEFAFEMHQRKAGSWKRIH
jgi:hypothetical protein